MKQKDERYGIYIIYYFDQLKNGQYFISVPVFHLFTIFLHKPLVRRLNQIKY